MVSLFPSLCQTQQMEAQMINSLTAGVCPRKLSADGGSGEDRKEGERKDEGDRMGNNCF